jgi:hypothetical protein
MNCLWKSFSKVRKSPAVKLVFSAVLLLTLRAAEADAAELSIEGNIDGTPTELRQLYDRAALLDAKIGELERRLSESQKAVIGVAGKETVDYRLELVPSADSKEKKEMLVSHVRMSLDGRPFVYTQSAIIISAARPLPLFMGKIPEGRHQVRLQFQVAPLTQQVLSGHSSSWRTVDRVMNLDVDAGAGKQQSYAVSVGESDTGESKTAKPSKNENDSAKAGDSLPLVLDKQKEMR